MADNTLITLSDIHSWTGEGLIIKLREFNFIPQEGQYMCPRCNLSLVLQKRASCADGYVWNCNNKVSVRKQKKARCGTQVSLRQKTFFERSHLQIWQVLGFAHLWICKESLTLAAQKVKISSTTAVDWAFSFQEVLLDKYLLQPEKVGGPGRIVEIAECKFRHRNYHRNHQIKGQWVFGGFEQVSGKVFMIPVKELNADTLLPVIKDWVYPGTTIISDCWRAYNCLNQEGYIHLKVDHLMNFKNPDSSTHIKYIGKSGRHTKETISSSEKEKYHLPGKLARNMFLKSCSYRQVNATKSFFELVSSLYNPLRDPLPDRNPEEVLSGYESDD